MKNFKTINIVDKILSGIFAIIFCCIFVIIGIATNNWVICFVGTGITIVSTAASHYVFRNNGNNTAWFVIKKPENMTTEEFVDQYNVLEDLGKGLYRVTIKRK